MPTSPPDPDPAPPRVLVLGPAESGKSAVAEQLLSAHAEVIYLATGPVPPRADDPQVDAPQADTEWAHRVEAHRRRRPPGWSTLETDDTATICALLTTPGPPVLIESLGTWVAAALQRPDPQRETAEFATAWAASRRPVVLVAEETGWGVIPATAVGRAFRTAQGRASAMLSAGATRVLLVVAGRVLELPAAAPLPVGAPDLTAEL